MFISVLFIFHYFFFVDCGANIVPACVCLRSPVLVHLFVDPTCRHTIMLHTMFNFYLFKPNFRKFKLILKLSPSFWCLNCRPTFYVKIILKDKQKTNHHVVELKLIIIRLLIRSNTCQWQKSNVWSGKHHQIFESANKWSGLKVHSKDSIGHTKKLNSTIFLNEVCWTHWNYTHSLTYKFKYKF